uniref:Reverse transcriptase domain-containing protein n=1 Tax=Salarias fasciatus TaxID=181472 RepID=A0A672I2C3_SALFA
HPLTPSPHTHPSGHYTQTHSLYADDILLYLQEPKTSVQEIFKLLTNFSSLSDYSVERPSYHSVRTHSHSQNQNFTTNKLFFFNDSI